MNIMEKKQISFNKFYKFFNILSISLIIISISLLLFKGLNYGVDFKGGTLIELRASDTQITISKLRQSLLNIKLGDVSVKQFGNKNDYLIQFEKKDNDNPNLIKESLVAWYEKHAEVKLKEKSKRYAEMMGVEFNSVGLKNYKSRWGSCSVEGDITFNWKIIMAPNRIVDYVVVHELCHLIHHDHSPKFWREVERIMPNYAECKEWLKLNGKRLDI